MAKKQKFTQADPVDLPVAIDPAPESAIPVTHTVTDADVTAEILRRYGNIHNNTVDALKAILRELVMARMARG